MSLPRKIVKPANLGADIPDPEHGNMPLPQEGSEVVWNAYWIARENGGDIVVLHEPATEAAAAEPAA